MSQHFVLKRTDDGTETLILDEVIAGRADGCGLLLPRATSAGGPSRRHARLKVADGVLWVEDLGSKNGTYVNDIPLMARRRTPLRPGDRVRFDQIELEVGLQGDDEPPTKVRPGPIRALTEPERLAAAPRPQAVAQSGNARGHSAFWAGVGDRVRRSMSALAERDLVGQALRPLRGTAPAARALPRSYVTDGDRPTELPDQPVRRPRLQGSQPAGPQARVGVPTLTLLSGALAGTRFELPFEEGTRHEWTLGSQADRDIVLAEPGVSRHHARIVNEGERWRILDDLSTCGTFVNDHRTSSSGLSSGDRLGFGPSVTCVFLLPTLDTDPDGRERRSGPLNADQDGRPPRPGREDRRGHFDWVTLLTSFLVTAAVLFILWHYLPGLRAYVP